MSGTTRGTGGREERRSGGGGGGDKSKRGVGEGGGELFSFDDC